MPSQKTIDELEEKREMINDDPDNWPPTATEIAMKQKQMEAQARAYQEQARHMAMNAVNAIGSDYLSKNEHLMKAMTQLASEQRYKDLQVLAETVRKSLTLPNATGVLPAKGNQGIGVALPGLGNIEQQQSRARQPRYSLSEKLSMRMGWHDIGDAADKHSTKLHIMHDSGKVFVFGVKNGEAFTLQDEADIFPSDQMVTQLRMVCGG